MQGKVIIVSAPSGTGKSTIIKALMDRGRIDMRFSVSATNRPPREGERDGADYHFMTNAEFRRHADDGDFVEYEEVYPGRFYGTLRSEIDGICRDGHNCILDIDVKGALNVKKIFGDRAMTLFITPPGIDALRARLEGRATDSPQEIDRRVDKAAEELAYAPQFDCRVVNDSLTKAVDDAERIILDYVSR